MKTKIVIYQEDDGVVPLLHWFEHIPSRAVAKCMVRIERLQELGYELHRPEADYLRDGIYELRIAMQGINYRILYFFRRNSSIVLSHGLTKIQKVSSKEIDKAIERKIKFETNPSLHTYKES